MTLCEQLGRHYFSVEERPHLGAELQWAGNHLQTLIQVPLSDGQWQALLSLTADLLGHHAYPSKGSLGDSELISLINKEMFQLAAPEFFRFVYINGRVDKRLWSKRNCEQLLFRRGRLVLP